MKKILGIFCSLIFIVLIAAPIQAEIVSVIGPDSSAGFPPEIIAAPGDILDDCVTNTHMQGFDEAQGVVTTVDHTTDDGVIPAGSVVDSHMIFLNSVGTGSLSHRNVEWTFDQEIIGVMSDQPGTLEAASTFELGAPGTNYTDVPTAPDTTPCGTNEATGERAAPYPLRGQEAQNECVNGGEGYVVFGDTIKVCMGVSEPGDWIRVITLGALAVPVDIKPGSCPNPLNVMDRGVFPVAILGTDEFDVTTIDPASVRLEGVAPLRWALEDVATPFEPFLGKEDCLEDCNELGSDGIMDLTLKFKTQEIVSALGDVEDGECLVLRLTGNLKVEFGGTPIVGEDVVLILE